MSQEGLLRPGIIQLRVLDMDEAITHYRDRIGLDFVSQEADGRVYLKAFDEFHRHSVVLREADSAGIDFFAFKADGQEAVDGFRKRIEEYGVDVTDVAEGEMPGTGKRISFMIPSGHRIDIYADMDLSETAPETHNPYVWKDEPRGMRAQRLDHCLLYGPNLPEVEKFFTEVLDFHIPERVDLPDGTLAIWMTVSNKAHDIAFVNHPEPGKLHHVAFFLEDWNDIGHAADVMTRYDISRDIGPTRHGITRGQTIYFFDPSGNRNEVFCGGYTAYKDHPTRVWDGNHVGRGIFYYERQMNDAFLSVVT
ncbi:catechol 2,3-dioxygenase [Celeribacter ethanolicus]|uniref:Metapyrocatechase n=1 Tax=Celeribacter ethanolicus TaxID=1758178 RepID=A0A291GD77_9RHOB|nr:catechol 2,3-dioxygenase [Celeribacter ethanolicus]ATG48127.1 catechol 2,3-dioxygenase [Celeribacter ethanolicus]